jgi:hypothetical protein
MAKHCSHGFAEMIEKARGFGCRILDKGNTIVIFPPDKSLPQYIAHKGEKALHPVRRYLKNTCGFAV